MKSDQLKEIEFIKSLLRKGSDRKAILQQFAKVYKNRSTKTIDNRLKIARTQMQSEIKQIEKRTEKIVKKEIKARKLQIMTSAERIDVLTKIAKGQIPLKKPMVVKDEIIMVPIVPDWNDRKNAIAELNKMDGSYAPIKQQIETSGVIKVGYGKKEGE
jgi:5-methylcytosine-specific restriction endonuclease McrBC GTP-binding regulatory subunit McrB